MSRDAVYVTFGSCISLYASAGPDGAGGGFFTGAGFGVPRVELREGSLKAGLARWGADGGEGSRPGSPGDGGGGDVDNDGSDGGGGGRGRRGGGRRGALGISYPHFAECVFRVVPKVEYAAALLLAEARNGGRGSGSGSEAPARVPGVMTNFSLSSGGSGGLSSEKSDARLESAVAQVCVCVGVGG